MYCSDLNNPLTPIETLPNGAECFVCQSDTFYWEQPSQYEFMARDLIEMTGKPVIYIRYRDRDDLVYFLVDGRRLEGHYFDNKRRRYVTRKANMFKLLAVTRGIVPAGMPNGFKEWENNRPLFAAWENQRGALYLIDDIRAARRKYSRYRCDLCQKTCLSLKWADLYKDVDVKKICRKNCGINDHGHIECFNKHVFCRDCLQLFEDIRIWQLNMKESAISIPIPFLNRLITATRKLDRDELIRAQRLFALLEKDK